MRFFTNLRPQTVEIYAQQGYNSSAWLLSSHRTSPQTLALAAELRDRGADLMADNGTKPLIDTVIDSFAGEARPLLKAHRALRKDQGEPSMSAMPDTVRRPARELADKVADAVDALLSERDWEAVVGEQLAMDPTHLIAPEDFCIGALVGLGLDRAMTGWSLDQFRRRNRISLAGWKRLAEDSRTRGRRTFVTLAAADYQSARAAAQLAAEQGASHVAVGFAGLNNLQTATQWTSLQRRRRLSRATGRRYLELAEILLGIRDGYAGGPTPLLHFHALGLGSRAQYALLAALLPADTEISVDATSPLHDAVQGRVLYDAPSQGRSRRVDNVAEQIVQGVELPLDGVFLETARRVHGHDAAAARGWWQQAGKPAIGMGALKPGEPLAETLGWLASGSGSTTTAVTSHWIGHNHAVCDVLTSAVPAEGTAAWARAEIQRLLSTQGFTLRHAALTWLEMLDWLEPKP